MYFGEQLHLTWLVPVYWTLTIWRAIVLFHNSFSPSGDQPEQRILACKSEQPTAGCIAMLHKYCCFIVHGGYNRNILWLRDTVRQTSRESAKMMNIKKPPKLCFRMLLGCGVISSFRTTGCSRRAKSLPHYVARTSTSMILIMCNVQVLCPRWCISLRIAHRRIWLKNICDVYKPHTHIYIYKYIYLPTSPHVMGVTKMRSLISPLQRNWFIENVVGYFKSRSNLSGVSATQLQWHLLNMKVVMYR